jgi:hypothetical protein
MTILVKAADLNQWANRKDAEAVLPRIVRRLIHATVQRIERIGFPADEGVQLGGWDGVVSVKEGNEYVPNGFSVWELGKNKEVKGKADVDYGKRCKDPRGVIPSETTFVFVTPRSWGGKEDWVKAKQTEGVWRDVRAYDAHDLEEWLEQAPSVHIWLSNLLGKYPDGATDLSNFWMDWSEATNPCITPDLVISGRMLATEGIYSWLHEPALSLALQADSEEEGLAFFAASVYQMEPEERIQCLARTIIVDDLKAWRRLSASDAPLILVPRFNVQDEVLRATRAGHKVLIPLGRGEGQSSTIVKIPRIRRQDAKAALVKMGLSEDQANDLATLTRRSLMALRRKLATNPELQRPKWAEPFEARTLLPAMLIGTWDDSNNADREVISQLAGGSYEEVNATLVRWANEADPPVRRVGNTWLLVSKEDAWILIAHFLTRADLDKFENVALEVLGQRDPSFDLPPDDRWKAGILGRSLAHSGLLREGIADTIALMGARSDATRFADAATGQHRASRIVSRLLNMANKDWHVWASLSYHLRSLAEAAPREFLDAVEAGLSGEQPILVNLFSEGDPLFSGSPHTGLLWALEILAWNPDYLGHTSLLLAKLARMEPGGKLTNRPHNSLRGIFLCWHPHTTAHLSQRLEVLDAIRVREPQIAWQLLCRLLPEHYSISDPIVTPRWREWTPDTLPDVTSSERWIAFNEIGVRLCEDVGSDGQRWQDIIEHFENLPKEQREVLAQRLLTLEVSTFDSTDRVGVWNALRRLISRHRQFSGTNWALPSNEVNYLEDAYLRLEPEDVKSKYAWLFSDMPDLLEPSGEDWQMNEERVATLSLEAVRQLYSEGGLSSLLDMVDSVEQPVILGTVLGHLELDKGDEVFLLSHELGSEGWAHRRFIYGFVGGRYQTQGWQWAENQLSNALTSWSSVQRADFLACLPFESRTWDYVDTMNADVEQLYWSQISPYSLLNETDCLRVVEKLIEYERPYTAITPLYLSIKRGEMSILPTVIAEVLEKATQTLPETTVNRSSLPYQIAGLLNMLQESSNIEEARIAALEWFFLPLLSRHKRPPRFLHRELSQNPDFFAEVVSWIYRAEDEEPQEPSGDSVVRAQLGRELLESWQQIPGTKDDGSVDFDTLKAWVSRALKVTDQLGRRRIGDQLIGKMLAFAPSDSDGSWPDISVRDLLEEVGNQDIELGIELGIYNNRGVVTKALTEGGEQERQLVKTYQNHARALRDRWPRTSAMMQRIAESYDSDARRSDIDAELTEDLWR